MICALILSPMPLTARSDLLELANRGLLEQRNRGRQFYFVAPPKLRARLQTGVKRK